MTTHRLASSVLLALVLSVLASSTASAQILIAPTPPPSSRVTIAEAPLESAPHQRPLWRAVAAGAGLLGGAWALNVVGSGLWMLAPTGVASADLLVPTWNGHAAAFFDWSLVPIVGPFAQMAYVDHPEWQLPLLAIDGLLQIAGLVTAIVGQVSRETVTRDDDGPQISVVPAVSAQSLGLNVTGSF